MTKTRWTRERANAWYAKQPWLVGCNFIPSTAVNQIEMWQEDTFDPGTIARELEWAANLGFNSARVFLHDLVWQANPGNFKKRINQYLDIAAEKKISTILVLFDDCWGPRPQIGTQPAPLPRVHNSRWVQSPGMNALKNPTTWNRLEDYVSDIISTYALDERVVIWDVYNEPGNYFMTSFRLKGFRRALGQYSLLFPHLFLPAPTLPLLRQAFTWARSVKPTQPLTAGLWFLKPGFPSRLNKNMLEQSDVITFHDYESESNSVKLIEQLQAHKRPILCTEYLARSHGNVFTTHLPLFKRAKIAAYNWGLVSGKTQTIYSWEDSNATTEPTIWYHDILRSDGTPYNSEETDFIRQITKTYQDTTN